MKVDTSKTEFHEHTKAKDEFSRKELRMLRLVLRRLRFLEAQVRKNGGLANGNATGGAAFAEWEVEALSWILTEIGFLADPDVENSKVGA